MGTFLIVSSVIHKMNSKGSIGGYGPYTKEMNLWLKYVDKVIVVAPLENKEFDAIDLAYIHNNIEFRKVPAFNLTSLKEIIKTLIVLPKILLVLFNSMREADHIHLRCPSNEGLLGSLVQIFFPNKIKTAKYAGNWDWNSRQPWSYRLQQRILRNSFLTRNMTTLVYGDWPDRTKNIKPFFTASYTEHDKIETVKPDIADCVNLVFVGTLSPNKSPITSLLTLKEIKSKGIPAHLTLCGDGAEKDILIRKSIEW